VKKPSAEELSGYCESLGLPASDGEYLFDKWTGNGWTNNGRAIKDWQATIRSWKRIGILPSQKGQPPSFEERKLLATKAAAARFAARGGGKS
jgi:hypothetical protein